MTDSTNRAPQSAKTRDAERAGSILLETLLVLPLYLVALGGMLWIGDIKLARQKLVVSDRYAAWNAGNRHRSSKSGIDGEIRHAFFRFEEIGRQSLAGVAYEGGEAIAWSAPVGAAVTLRMAMPEWTRGWLAGSALWSAAAAPAGAETLTGRRVEQASRHVVLMRNRYGEAAYRSPRWLPAMLADWSRPWDEYVWREPWPATDDLKGMSADGLRPYTRAPSGPAGYEHRRHGGYVRWSD
jgi:hypothetical protein